MYAEDFFPNYFFIKLLMSQQEGTLMLLYLRNLMRWGAGVFPLPSSLHRPGRSCPTDLICRLPCPPVSLDTGQESAAGVTRVPSPSVCGLTVVFCVPQRSHSSCHVTLPKHLSLWFPSTVLFISRGDGSLCVLALGSCTISCVVSLNSVLISLFFCL